MCNEVLHNSIVYVFLDNLNYEHLFDHEVFDLVIELVTNEPIGNMLVTKWCNHRLQLWGTGVLVQFTF